MEIVSLREHPELLEKFIAYFTLHWGNKAVYRDCMTASLTAENPLPQWFLLFDEAGKTLGGAGLITNDFVSRMDLYPWLCALFVEEEFRCQGWGGKLIMRTAEAAKQAGFRHLYCCTGHTGYYERYGFTFIGTGYHPWDDTSRIYEKKL